MPPAIRSCYYLSVNSRSVSWPAQPIHRPIHSEPKKEHFQKFVISAYDDTERRSVCQNVPFYIWRNTDVLMSPKLLRPTSYDVLL